MKTDFTTTSPGETRDLAAEILDHFPAPRVFALYGDLGSGKTCFVQGIAAALGINRIVSSPTFTLINEYRATPSLYHIDLYRLSDPVEALGIGLEDYLASDGITAIEWAEKADELIPPSAVRLTFTPGPDPESRNIQLLTASGTSR